MESYDTAFEKYFNLLYCNNYGSVAVFLKRFFDDYALCEEIAQETFLKIYKNRVILTDSPLRQRNYLLTVARNIATDYCRRQSVETKRLMEFHYQETVVDDIFCSQLEEACIEGEIIETLYDVIGESPAEEREIYLDITLRGATLSDVSNKRNVSLYRMKSIQRKIDYSVRERLKPLWSDEPASLQT